MGESDKLPINIWPLQGLSKAKGSYWSAPIANSALVPGGKFSLMLMGALCTEWEEVIQQISTQKKSYQRMSRKTKQCQKIRSCGMSGTLLFKITVLPIKLNWLNYKLKVTFCFQHIFQLPSCFRVHMLARSKRQFV